MDRPGIVHACTAAALEAGRRIRETVHGMHPLERGRASTSILKPTAGYGARRVDAAAEDVGIVHLERLSRDIGLPIDLLVDPRNGTAHRIGRGGPPVVWACMDAIDGTVKVAGLGEPSSSRVRVANDGGWAAAFAFTAPTDKRLEDLVIADFTVAIVVDGNPTTYRSYPQDLVARPGKRGLETVEVTDGVERRVFTGSSTTLGQSFVFLDVFQAYDHATRREGDEALGVALYRLLTDRHGGGAFDVLRQYANLSALPRVLLGWREAPVWIESQGAAYLVVNENLANLIPAVPLVAGAGGISVDFAGRPLGLRRLVDGRTSIVHAANEPICRQVLALIASAQPTAAT